MQIELFFLIWAALLGVPAPGQARRPQHHMTCGALALRVIPMHGQFAFRWVAMF